MYCLNIVVALHIRKAFCIMATMNSAPVILNQFLDRWTSSEDRLLVAVSGGADSMGLLALLTDEMGFGSQRLRVAHINHQLRPTVEEDLRVVEGFARECGVPLSVRKVDVLDAARREHLSLEAAARRLRYRALEEIAEETGCRWILTAHTMDDSAETVLMRMRSGAPWYEWTGIPARRGRILRPLLTVRRPVLREWVRAHEVPFREDESNGDVRFQRNRLRNILESCHNFWNDSVVINLFANGRELEWALESARKAVYLLPSLINATSKEGRIGLAIDEIFRYFNNLTFLPVEALWAKLCVQPPESRLPSHLRRQIAEFLQGTTPDARLSLPKNVVLVRRGTHLWLIKGEIAAVNRSVTRGKSSVPERKGHLVVADVSNGQPAVLVRREILDHHLTLRSWQAGDRIKPMGRPRKKIADLLSERKLDPVERAEALVLCDEDGPLLIVGGVVDERATAKYPQGETITIRWSEDDSRGAGNDL
jgi:tRNA(Ile)-lysidine synthase